MVDDELELEFEDEAPKIPTPSAPAAAPRPLAVAAQAAPKAAPKPLPQAAAAPVRPQPAKPTPVVAKPVSQIRAVAEPSSPSLMGSNALKLEPFEESYGSVDANEVVDLREQLKRTEFEAQVKIQVAEFKTEILGELLGDIKLMDYKINQLLSRIHTKHPEMKQEVLMIKKILTEFSSKKRK